MFRTTTARLIRYTGHTVPERVDPAYGATIRAAEVSLESRYSFLAEGRIQGSRAHRSTTDPSDPQEVIAVRYYTTRGLRLLSIHAHDDGTWKEFLSRPGRRLLDRLELVKGRSQGGSRADEDIELP